jgi:hypothetical protein
MQPNFEEIDGYPVKPGGIFVIIARLHAVEADR